MIGLKLNYFILILFLILIINIDSQEINNLNQVEYDCLEKLLTNLRSIQYVKKYTTISGYNFCSTPIGPMGNIACSYNDTIVWDLSLIGHNQSFIVQDEFSCFKNISSLRVDDINVSNTFFETLPPKINSLEQTGNNLVFGKLPRNILYYMVYLKTIQFPSIFKFSWFLHLNQMFLRNPFSITIDISFENDLETNQFVSTYFSIIASKFPNLTNINSIIELQLLTGYDQSSLSQLLNCNMAKVLDVSSNDLTLLPTLVLSQFRSPYLTKLTFDMPLKEVNSVIDLSFIGERIKILSFKNVGNNFTYGGSGGSLPIIFPINQDFQTFEFNNGTINNFNFSIFSHVQNLLIPGNSISSTLQPFNRTTHFKFKTLDISNNQFYGTIDESFCELDLIVSNNNFTGLIPPCFTCFFGLPNINLESRFSGNNFLNLNTPSSPSIIVPNIHIGEINYIFGFIEYSFYIFGVNIGGNWMEKKNIQDPSGGEFSVLVLVPNRLILIRKLYVLPPVIHLVYSESNPNYNFTLSLTITPPQLKTIDWKSSTTDLVFDGSYLTYNKSIVNIRIGNEDCLVKNTTFYQIKCTLSNVIDSSIRDILSYITIGNLTTQFTLNPGSINTILNCTNNYNDCNGNGYCLSDIGKCKCYSNYQGDDCSILHIECLPNDCNNGNGGVCNYITGECQCDSNHQGSACELPFNECLNQCNNNMGKCNNQTGICTCPINPHAWSGIDCSIPLHTISGASPSNTNGGIASIYGWFGNIHTGKQVFIGNQECTPIYNFTETEIICNSPAGTGLKSISVIQNSINVTSKDIYQYYSNDKQCPNHCTSTLNGICNSTTGYCNCIGRWSGYDCSLYSNTGGGNGNNDNNNNGLPVSNTTIDGNTGGTNFNNQQTNFEILITNLIEIDFNGNQIKEYSLLNNWVILSNISKIVFTFIQSIQNNQCNITYTIEEIDNDRDVSFAGIDFKLTGGSIKMTVSIENYQYSSNLNTLQLQMKSSVSEIQTNDKNDCNNYDQIEINSIPNQENILNYIVIKKDSKVLNGRFLDRIESDGKSTFMQTVLISKSNDSIIVGMNLPHCTKKCFLDPDFSVLISPEFIGECGGDDKYEPWFLPVVIVVPVVCMAAIIVVVVLIYKKKFVDEPFKNKIKMLANNNKNL
ncbi:hypothetical protein ACTA71_005370 [Dictyostelium dimigraforme]